MALPTTLQQAVAAHFRGPVEVRWDATGTPIYFYADSVEASLASERETFVHPIAGQYEDYIVSEMITLTFTLDEQSSNAFAVLMSHGYQDSATARSFGRSGGTALRASFAKQLEVRPFADRAAETHKIVIWKAIQQGDLSIAMGQSDGAMSVTYTSLADLAKADGALHGQLTLPARA